MTHPFDHLAADELRARRREKWRARPPEARWGGGAASHLRRQAPAFADGARAVVLCNPHNPAGRVASREDLESVAALGERHEVQVLSDEVHAQLTYPGHQHVPFAALDGTAARRSVTFASASK